MKVALHKEEDTPKSATLSIAVHRLLLLRHFLPALLRFVGCQLAVAVPVPPASAAAAAAAAAAKCTELWVSRSSLGEDI